MADESKKSRLIEMKFGIRKFSSHWLRIRAQNSALKTILQKDKKWMPSS